MTAKPSCEELEKRVLGLESEIARLRRSESELVESLERYQIHFSLTTDVIYTLDAQLRATSVSPGVEAVLGYSPDELVGRPFPDLHVLAPEYLEAALMDIVRVFSGESVYSSIYQFITKKGGRVFGEVSGVPLVRDGEVTAVISVARDITGRLEMEKSLRESEWRFRTVFDSAQDCIFIKDATLRYIFVNPFMTRLFGLSALEILGKYDADLFGVQTGSRLRETDRRVIAGGIVKEENELMIGGEALTFHVIKVPMLDGSGNVNGLCGIARNITERKKFEQELHAKEKQLELQAGNLKEINTALKVLLDHRDQERKKVKEDIVSHAETLLYPYLDRLRDAGLGGQFGVYLDIIRANLDELISPCIEGPPAGYRGLTPMEITIADLVKQGKTTKEISGLLNVSSHAVSFHRANIRRKLKLLHTKANLRSHLLQPDAGQEKDL
jgi:PAS domain S-box-containing protein